MPADTARRTGICRLDAATGLCEGCGRSVAEIARWPGLTEAERKTIIAGLPCPSQGAARRGD